MSRLYDRVMSGCDDGVRKMLAPATVISVDNVARYYWEGSAQEVWDILHDFPNIAPPLETLFIEYRPPKQITSEKFGTMPWPYPIRSVGFAMHADDANPDTEYTWVGTRLAGVRWLVECLWFVDFGHGNTHEPLAYLQYLVSAKGAWMGMQDGKIRFGCGLTRYSADYADKNGVPHETLRQGLGHEAESMLRPILLALSFMHCKNVVTRVERPPDWQQKAAMKKHKRPLVTYHVLEIEPMKQVLRTEGKSEEVGLKRALHICRGHFATYDEKPLFGRVKGTFWREAHVRGSLKEGLALKDYDVKAPTPIR